MHLNARGDALEFSDRAYLPAIYNDQREQIVIQKAARLGISEWLLVEVFDLAMKKLNGMYCMPDQHLRNQFVTDRFDRTVYNVPLYAQHVGAHPKAVDSRGLKTIFGSTWAFVGTQQPQAFFSFDADAMLYDEYDRCDPEALVYAKDRIGSSKYGYTRKIGNPTISGFGINYEYENSDGKVWHVQCEHCNERQPLEWLVNFVRQADTFKYELLDSSLPPGAFSGNGGQDASAFCRRCNRPINRLAVGQWVAQRPGHPVSGYKVSRLFGDVRPKPVIREFFGEYTQHLHNATEMQRFHNTVLGEVYAQEGSQISESMMAACAEAGYAMPFESRGCVAGVDINLGLHVHISQVDGLKRKKVFVGVVGDYPDIAALCVRYNVQCGVFDAGPEIRGPRDFVVAHPGWYLCRYAVQDKLTQDQTNPHEPINLNFKACTVNVNRTESLDRSYAAWQQKQVILPENWRMLDNGEFAKQMSMPTRVTIETPQGLPRVIWTKGVDHHRHADNYENIAFSIYCQTRNMVSLV